MRAASFISLFSLILSAQSCLVIHVIELCLPSTPTTFFLAYSNDIDSATMSDFLAELETFYWGWESPQFTVFAFIRFDVADEEAIEFYSNPDDWLSALNTSIHTPSPSFQDPNTPSDVINTINKFLNSNRFPICGSRIVIHHKRMPEEQDTQEIVSILQKNHISLYTITPESADDRSKILAGIAGQTDGYGVLSTREDFMYSTPMFEQYYCIYAVNIQVSGTGVTESPKMRVRKGGYYHYMLFSASRRVEGTKDVLISWNSNATSNNWEMNPNDENANGNTCRQRNILDPVTYDMTLSYFFKDNLPFSVNVRVYTTRDIDYWASYNNV